MPQNVNLAPNGRPSNLSPEDWAFVRSAEFKAWAGDWEKKARIEKLKRSVPLEVTGDRYVGKYSLDNRSAEEYIKVSLRQTFVNNDTGDKIILSRRSADKVTRHDAESEIHLKSIAYIPEMIRDAVFIEELDNEKGVTGFDSYRYYILGMKVDGVDYTAKLVVGKAGNNYYYDHALTQIEKGNLLSIIDEIKCPFGEKEVLSEPSSLVIDGIKRSFGKEEDLSGIKDKRLISILQTDCKILLDENLEPKAVYHGTTQDFSAFDLARGGENTGLAEYTDTRTGEKLASDSSRCVFFTDSYHQAASYALLRHHIELLTTYRMLRDVYPSLRTGKVGGHFGCRSKEEFWDFVDKLRDTVPSLAALPQKISDMSETEKQPILEALQKAREEYKGFCEKMDNGGLSNQVYNVYMQRQAIQTLRDNAERLRRNDPDTPSEHGTFRHYQMGIFGGSGNTEVTLYLDEGRIVYLDLISRQKRFFDQMDDAAFQEAMAILDRKCDEAERMVAGELKTGGYNEAARIYRCFLKLDDPLVHDYQGSAFPDRYKANEKYPTAYIAARQVAAAGKRGHDGVVYEHIRDPFEATTYGVFSGDQVMIRERQRGISVGAPKEDRQKEEFIRLGGAADMYDRLVARPDGTPFLLENPYVRPMTVADTAPPQRANGSLELFCNGRGEVFVTAPGGEHLSVREFASRARTDLNYVQNACRAQESRDRRRDGLSLKEKNSESAHLSGTRQRKR